MKTLHSLFLFVIFSFSIVLSQHVSRHFNGYEFFNVNDDPALRITNNLTFEAWVFLDDNVNNTIIDKGSYNHLFQTHPNGNQGLGLYSRSFGWIYSAGTVPTNQWVHVAVTFQTGANGVKFYLNGQILSVHSTNTPLASDTGLLNIGRQDPLGCRCNLFNGDMDDLKIWNVVRSEAEIVADMNNSNPNNDGLVAYFPFDEGEGSTTVSSTVGGFIGTLQDGSPKKLIISAGEGGTITPSGSWFLNQIYTLPWILNRNVRPFDWYAEITITPDEGYQIADVLVDGVSVGAVSSYTIPSRRALITTLYDRNITISATFKVNNLPPVANAGEDFSTIAGVPFTLDGSESSDPDGDNLIYIWYQGDYVVGEGEKITLTVNQVGDFTYKLTVYDSNELGDSDEVTVSVTPFPIVVDIKPGDSNNKINLKNKGVIPVAVITTDEFDVATLDISSLAFGPGGAGEEHNLGHYEDVDGDGDIDLMLHFDTQTSALLSNENQAGLRGFTLTGIPVEGSDFYDAGKLKKDGFSEDQMELPGKYALNQNYPNPFNPATTIKIAIPEAGYYSLKVYNTLGQVVANLHDGQLGSGYYSFNFDASSLSTGMYIYTLKGNNVNISMKMNLIK